MSVTNTDHSLQIERLRAARSDPNSRILIRGATILSMDPHVGDFARGDVLIQGKKIIAVASSLEDAARNGNTITIDASGSIAVPGFQDTHRHCWQNQLRRLIPDCNDNGAYLDVTHHWLGHHYRPEDIYIGNLISALGALESGVTTILDLFHNPRTPEHSDAAIAAFQDVGIRGVHASCGPLSGDWDNNWPSDLDRIRSQYFNTDDQLLSLRFATIGGDFAAEHVRLDAAKIRLARQMGLPLISDGVLGEACSRRINEFAAEGLLGPDLTFIHCLDLDETAWKLIADNGVNVSIPTTSDAIIGISDTVPSIQKALDVGIKPGLSVDVEVTLTPDMFTQMRTLHAIQRMMIFSRRYAGETDLPEALRVRDVLELATVSGAKTNGNFDKSGTLTPGKEADLVLIGAEDFNTMPLNNAYGTVVSGADTSNVHTVFVAGSVKKFGGKLVGWNIADIRTKVHASRDHILTAGGFDLDIFEQQVGLLGN
ncbi:amidohydrolase family protein [Rhodococcus opacus]|uniref:amidohydrolase family protein n=1 Tax=Rhodococcus opacus TaxID=37919 RepID=UPI001C46516A|nr:amidohydrolase family protein [Rhodococcus opacus]MBV6760427.1 amidohydrolase family protein [Rhodococcus opacus]